MFPKPGDRLKHEKYQMNLPKWEKFIIWTYTVGSGAVNRYLLGEEVRITEWANNIIKSYRDNFSTMKAPYMSGVFSNQAAFNKSPNKVQLSLKLMKLYIMDLKDILRGAPKLSSNIKVYKTSGGIPDFKVGNTIQQKAFNSSTFRRDTDLIPFLRQDHCCYHEMIINRDVDVLFISPVLSAYPDENEVLISPDSMITVRSNFTTQLYESLRETKKQKTVQRPPFKIGQIYMSDHALDCPQRKVEVKGYRSYVHK